MDFKTDIFSLDKPKKVTFNLVGAKLPSTNDLYFRAKQEELVEQYAAARALCMKQKPLIGTSGIIL